MYDRDRAWAAGFFDAEGCFSRTGANIVATISQTELECLDVFSNCVQIGTLRGPIERTTPTMRRRPQYVWYVYGARSVASVYEYIRPWVGKSKRAKAAAVLRTPTLGSGPAFADAPWRERVAWAGGFFDGEGCFSWTGDGLNGRITHTDAELLGQFRDVMGFGKVYGPYQPHHTSFGKKAQYVFTVSGLERVQALLAILWDDLGSAKRVKAMALLEEHLTHWKCGHRRGVVWQRNCPKCWKPGPKPGFKRTKRNAGTPPPMKSRPAAQKAALKPREDMGRAPRPSDL